MKLYTDNVVKKYRSRTVVKGASVEVSQGEIVGLLGPNGAGKTTTFYMVVGIIKPFSGKVFLAPFRIAVPPGTLKANGNVLEIEVTSVAANRIRHMDRTGVKWRTFHDINFASYKGGKFDASQWPLTVNGLLGPVVFKTP